MSGLMDVAQAASNAVAGNVSGPVDMLAFLLRKAGVPVPEDPVLGTEWLKKRGLIRDVPQGAAQVAGETLGLLAPVAVAAKAPQIASGLLRAQENAAAPRTLRPDAGAIVWHGSPHKFDRFDSSKIGTGEGAQAYGHGLYLAESPDVANQYARELSAKISVNDKPLLQANRRVGTTGNSDLDDYLTAALGDAKAARRELLSDIRQVRPTNRAAAKDMQRTLADLRNAKVTASAEGQLYKVDLPDDQIARMLDWDRPFSQQAPEVRKALQNAEVVGRDDWLISGMRGREIYNRSKFGAPVKLPLRQIDDEIYAAQRLRQAGIPGIRYLDGGSRGAGSGTSNFVVFPGEEGLLTILERNGVPLGR